LELKSQSICLPVVHKGFISLCRQHDAVFHMHFSVNVFVIN
jgi:hypothetical protein